MCQSTTGTAPWLNRLVNKHHTHTGRELGCGAAAGGGGADRRFGPRLLSTPLSPPPPAAPRIARPNLQLHQSSTRLTAPHKSLCPQSCFLSSIFLSLPLPHTHTRTLCICLTLSPGSARRQHRHRGGGDSSDGKTEGFFLSSPGVPPPLPSPPLFLTLCLSPVCLLLEWGPHRCSKPHPSSLAVMSTFAHRVLANNLPTAKMCLTMA